MVWTGSGGPGHLMKVGVGGGVVRFRGGKEPVMQVGDGVGEIRVGCSHR